MIDLLILCILLVFHGVFALIEISFISSKKIRLQERLRKGNKSAGIVLRLLTTPERLLSTIQFWITVLGIVAGVYGGASFANKIEPFIALIPFVSAYAMQVSYILVASFLTYLSVIIGDLVPKSIGLTNPEKFAIFFARFMVIAEKISLPVVHIFSLSTRTILKLLIVRGKDEPPVTADELKLLIYEANQHGVLESRETEYIQSLLRLHSLTAAEIMKPLEQISWINYSDSFETIHQIILSRLHARYPVYEANYDNVVGIISANEFMSKYHKSGEFKLEEILDDPLIVSSEIDAIKLLDQFRMMRRYLAIVADDNRVTKGIITLHDLIETIVGKLPDFYETEDDRFYVRDDGSVLLDADVTIEEVKKLLTMEPAITDNKTLNVAMYDYAGRIPRVGDKFTMSGYEFEIVDMDGARVDKVMAKKIQG